MTDILSKVRKLAGHPGFRAEPLAVLSRGAMWAACVAARRAPAFYLTPGRERMRVPPDMRYTSVTSFLLRDWTEPELRRLDRFVRPGDVFLDVGANIGLFSLKAARIVGPAGRVLAIEPGSTAAARLEDNLSLNAFAQVQVVRRALSDRQGTACLHHNSLGDDLQGFSLLSDGSGAGGETVETTTLDALCAGLGLARLDCVKMDVEGAEPQVIEGGRGSLARWRPIVIFEINAAPVPHAGHAAEAFELLSGLGYVMWQVRGDDLVAVSRQPAEHGNLVAVHPDGVKPAA